MKTYEYIQEAARIVFDLAENEGVLSDEDEEKLIDWASGTEDKLEAWRAIYRRAEAEAMLAKAEALRHSKIQKRFESVMVRAKLAGVDLLEARELVGESTNVQGVAHLMRGTSFVAPKDLASWPAEYLVEQDPKPDRTAARKAMQNGKSLGDGFRRENRSSIVWK